MTFCTVLTFTLCASRHFISEIVCTWRDVVGSLVGPEDGLWPNDLS